MGDFKRAAGINARSKASRAKLIAAIYIAYLIGRLPLTSPGTLIYPREKTPVPTGDHIIRRDAKLMDVDRHDKLW